MLRYGKRDASDPLAAPSFAALRGESAAFELQWRSRSFEGHMEPLRGVGGTVIGTLGMALDVSERKQIERDAAALALHQDVSDQYRANYRTQVERHERHFAAG